MAKIGSKNNRPLVSANLHPSVCQQQQLRQLSGSPKNVESSMYAETENTVLKAVLTTVDLAEGSSGDRKRLSLPSYFESMSFRSLPKGGYFSGTYPECSKRDHGFDQDY